MRRLMLVGLALLTSCGTNSDTPKVRSSSVQVSCPGAVATLGLIMPATVDFDFPVPAGGGIGWSGGIVVNLGGYPVTPALLAPEAWPIGSNAPYSVRIVNDFQYDLVLLPGQAAGRTGTIGRGPTDYNLDLVHTFFPATSLTDAGAFALTLTNTSGAMVGNNTTGVAFAFNGNTAPGLATSVITHDPAIGGWASVLGAVGSTVTLANRSYACLDIDPGSKANKVSLKPKSEIEVALLSGNSFNPLTTNLSSVRFGPAEAGVRSSRLKDVNGDGRSDLLLTFGATQTGLTCTDRFARLHLLTQDSVYFEGYDSVLPNC